MYFSDFLFKYEKHLFKDSKLFYWKFDKSEGGIPLRKNV